MKRSVVAWVVFAMVVAVPSVMIYWIAERAAIAEDHQLRQARYERRVEAAKALQREMELAHWKTDDALRMLSIEANPVDLETALVDGRGAFHDAFLLDAAGDLVVPGDPAAKGRVSAILAETNAHAEASDPSARAPAIPSALAGVVGRPGALGNVVFVVYRHGTSGYVAFRRRPAGGEVGFATNDASVRRGCAHFLPDDLTVAPVDDDGPRDVHEYDRRYAGGKVSIALPIKDEKTRVTIPSTELSYEVVPKAPGMAARELRRPPHTIPLITALAIVFWVTTASVLFVQKQRAQRLAELRTDFVAAVSHELRTPLASVRMLAELLEAGVVSADERPEIERTLAGESRRLAGTLERMLRFGALARGKLVAAKEKTPVLPILQAASARLALSHPDVEVTIEASPSLEASVDPMLVGLALDNLLANAAKYAPEGGPYAVEAHAEDGHVIVSVADRGPGIDARSQGRVFQPFERGDSRLSRATEGTGVGLALVRGIARAHGGEAIVTSKPHVRTTFALRLPRS